MRVAKERRLRRKRRKARQRQKWLDAIAATIDAMEAEAGYDPLECPAVFPRWMKVRPVSSF